MRGPLVRAALFFITAVWSLFANRSDNVFELGGCYFQIAHIRNALLSERVQHPDGIQI